MPSLKAPPLHRPEPRFSKLTMEQLNDCRSAWPNGS